MNFCYFLLIKYVGWRLDKAELTYVRDGREFYRTCCQFVKNGEEKIC